MKEEKIKDIVPKDGKKIVMKPDFKDLHKVTSGQCMQYLEFFKIWYVLQVNLYYTAVSTLEPSINKVSWEMVWDHINS